MIPITHFRSIFYLLFLLLATKALYCQNLDNLDKKFGINKFKLESDISLYKNNIVFDLKGDDQVEYYKYSGEDFKSLFGVSISNCALGFYKKKLYSISINFGEISKFDQDIINYKLKSLFGLPDLGSGNSPLNYQWFYFWKTSKTYLAFSKLSENSDYKPGTIDIFMFSRKLHEVINNANF